MTGLQTPELRARARQTDRAEPVPTRQLPSVAIEPGLQPRRGARNLPDSLQRKGLRHDHRVSARGAVGPSRTTKDSALESVEPGKSAGPREQASVVAASSANPPVRVGAGRVRRSRPEHTPTPRPVHPTPCPLGAGARTQERFSGPRPSACTGRQPPSSASARMARDARESRNVPILPRLAPSDIPPVSLAHQLFGISPKMFILSEGGQRGGMMRETCPCSDGSSKALERHRTRGGAGTGRTGIRHGVHLSAVLWALAATVAHAQTEGGPRPHGNACVEDTRPLQYGFYADFRPVSFSDNLDPDGPANQSSSRL